MNTISRQIKYNNSPSSLIPIDELFKADTIILEGHNRHEAVLRISESLIQRNKKILSLDKIKKLAYEWNQQHCKPPLDDKEFERQWNDALKFVFRSKSETSNNNSGNNEEINLVEIARLNCTELFVDQYNVPHASVKINEHIEIMSLNDKRFRNLIIRICYNETKKISNEKAESIINILKADAEINGNIKYLDLRIRKIDNYTFFYDLTNSKWSVIRITPSGWSVVEKDIPILFKRYANQQSQVNPSSEYSNDIFDKFMELINIQDEDTKLLLKCYIISLFIPDIAKPILMLHGEQGSAKSTLQELIKMLVDPSIVKTHTFPRGINELIQILSHNYIAYFDNVSIIRD